MVLKVKFFNSLCQCEYWKATNCLKQEVRISSRGMVVHCQVSRLIIPQILFFFLPLPPLQYFFSYSYIDAHTQRDSTSHSRWMDLKRRWLRGQVLLVSVEKVIPVVRSLSQVVMRKSNRERVVYFLRNCYLTRLDLSDRAIDPFPPCALIYHRRSGGNNFLLLNHSRRSLFMGLSTMDLTIWNL